jgi:hypothetical protein
LLLMSVDPLVSMVLLMSMDSCERTVETVEFADVLPCKKSSIRLRSLERPRFVIPVTQQQIALTNNSSTVC